MYINDISIFTKKSLTFPGPGVQTVRLQLLRSRICSHSLWCDSVTGVLKSLSLTTEFDQTYFSWGKV